MGPRSTGNVRAFPRSTVVPVPSTPPAVAAETDLESASDVIAGSGAEAGSGRPTAVSPRRLIIGTVLGLAGVVASLFAGVTFPPTLRLEVGSWVEAAIEWSYNSLAVVYDVSAAIIEGLFDSLLFALVDTPALTLALALVLIAYVLRGGQLALLTVGSLGLTVAVGLWDQTLVTLAQMVVAVGIAVVLGIALGVVAAQFRWLQPVVTVLLDAMQTFPIFAYLVPVVFIFGPGNVAALVVTIIWSLPPITRMTLVGLRSISVESLESAASLGSTRWQSLTGVELPLASRSIRAGLNQTIMYAMAMVIIAAMIGASGLGQPVWGSLTRLEFGRAFEAGVVLVLLAIIMDRASEGTSPAPSRLAMTRPGRGWTRVWGRIVARFGLRRVAGVVVFVIAALFIQLTPALRRINLSAAPEWLEFSIRNPVDDGIDWVNLNLGFLLDPIIVAIHLYALTPLMDFFLWLPWPAVVLGSAGLALVLLGRLSAGLVALGVVGIGMLGMWDAAAQTLATAGAAFFVVLIVALPTGVLMSRSDTIERLLRPVLDVLQTLPIFLFVIPAAVVFGTGPVAGVFATVLYAVAPVIRLTNVALRGVEPASIEAATSTGATNWQMLYQVRLPLGLSTLMVGINQGIMLSLSMAVVSAFIGTPGLGQELLVGVHTGRLDIGVNAGLAMFLVAVVVDRLLSGASRTVQKRNYLERA